MLKRISRALAMLIFAFLPFMASAQGTSCNLTVHLWDSYGDGWSGNALQFYQNNVLVGSATLDEDEDFSTVSISVSSNDSVIVRFVRGSYPEEASFMILSADLDTILGRTYGTNLANNAVVASFLNICPSCPAPADFVVDSVSSTSVYLSWSSSNSAFDVAVLPVGSRPDASTNPISVTGTSYEFANLDASVLHDFYVRANCGGSDESRWIGPVTATPGMYVFPTSGSDTVETCSLHIFDNGGPSGRVLPGSHTLVLRPESDTAAIRLTGTVNLDNYGSASLAIYDGEGLSGTQRGYFTGANNNVDITSVSGSLTIRFNCNYMNAEAAGFSLQASCAHRSNCVAPTNAVVSDVRAASALVSWEYLGTDLDDATFVVEVVGGTSFYANGATQTRIYGLQPSTQYTALVYTSCADGASAADTLHFTTACVSGGQHESSHGEYTTSAVPINTYNSATVSQALYLPEELGLRVGDTIYSIALFASRDGDAERKISIYMAESQLTSISGLADLQMPTPADFRFADTAYRVHDGWNVFNLSTPHVYGGGSMLVTFLDRTGLNHSTTYWRSTRISNRTLYRTSYSNMLDTASLHSSNLNAQRADIRFDSPCRNTGCAAPVVTVERVLADTVVLSWVPGYDELVWQVSYREAYADEWTDLGYTYDLNYTAAGLDPNTDYIFRIATICADLSNPHTDVAVTTDCGPLMRFPFTEGFEHFIGAKSANSPFQPCWYRATNHSYYLYPYVQSSTSYNYAHTGSAALNFVGNSTTYSYLVLPEMGLPLDTFDIEFYIAPSGSYSGAMHVVVGAITDPADLSTFQALDTATASGSPMTYSLYSYSFRGYAGNARYIAIRTASTDPVTNLYIDDIRLDRRRDCYVPDSIRLVSSTLNSLTLGWTSMSGEYEVAYSETPFDSARAVIVSTTDDTLAVTSLMPSTRYSFQIRSICGADTSVWSSTFQFHTECATLTLPYTETFEGYEAADYAPVCWSVVDTTYDFLGSSRRFGPSVSGVAAYSSSRSLVIAADPVITAVTGVSLPELPAGVSASQTQLRLAYRNDVYSAHGATSGILVGVCSVPGSRATFQVVDTIFGNYGDWMIDEIDLSSYTGTGRYVSLFSYDPDHTTKMYLDNIELRLAPTCAKASNLRQTAATATSATVAWTAPAAQTAWQIEYGPRGFAAGQGTIVAANSNPFTIANLPANSVYEFNVRAICSATDTAEWALHRGYLVVGQTPAQLPYSYDFESGAEWANWGVASNNSNTWYRGTGSHGQGSYGIYISSDNGATRSYSSSLNAVAYRDFDFGTGDSVAVLDFKAISGGFEDPLGDYYDNFYVLVADPSAAVIMSDNTYQSPWGPVDQLSTLFSLRVDTNWRDYQIQLPQLSGVHRLVFYYNVHEYSSWLSQGPAAVDDVRLAFLACPNPSNLRVESVSNTGASLAWDGTASSYELRIVGNGTQRDTLVSSNSVVLSGLVSGETYSCYVTAVCGASRSMIVGPVDFHVSCYAEAIANFPYVEDFENGISCWENLRVSGSYDWTAGSESFYTQVDSAYTGEQFALFLTESHNNAARLVSPMFALDPASPATLSFAHAQVDYFGDLDTLAVQYRLSPASPWVTLAHYTSEYADWAVETLSLPAVSNTFQIAFLGYGEYGYGVLIDHVVVDGAAGGCVAPRPTVAASDFESATISWTGSASSYEYSIVEHGLDYGAPQAVAGNTISFADLLSNTQYDFRVRQICDGETSPWGELTFTTDSLPCAVPQNLHAASVEHSAVTVAWTAPAGTSARAYVVRLYNSTTDRIDTVSATQATFAGLYDNTLYYVTVQSQCAARVFSEESAPLSVTTTTCQPVSNVAVSDVTAGGATITWTAGADETSWEVSYGDMDFTEGNGTNVTVTSTTYTISGLQPNHDYDVYVRAKCGGSNVSDWSAKKRFSTAAGQGIDGVEGSYSLSIYPNPASGNTVISLRGVEGRVEISVVDINGRVISSETISCGADCTKSMDVANLAQGTYFVRVLGDGISSVRKLIVR